MDQDHRDVDFQPAEEEPDGGDHQGAQGDAAAGRRQLPALRRPLLSGGQGQPDPGQHGKQRRRPPGEGQSDPGGRQLRVGFERGQQVGGHHAQQRQPAGGVDSGEPWSSWWCLWRSGREKQCHGRS